MKKRIFYTELSYLFGLIAIAAGVAFMEKSDFGVSMVVAPAYLLYLKLSETLPFVTFGMAEYLLQAALLAAIVLILRRFRLTYLFSFVTAVIYSFVLDGCMILASFMPADVMLYRVLYYAVGILLCALGVAFMFHTYIPPEAYELFVSEVSKKFGVKISIFKTFYDIISCAAAVVMSFCFFGLWHFEGVKLGTIICAAVNGTIIGKISSFLEKRFIFVNKFHLKQTRV